MNASVPLFFRQFQRDFFHMGAVMPSSRYLGQAAVDDTLATGQRLGLIKFGSRVDLLLPANTELLVHTGQKVYGGQTIVARWLV